MITCPICSKTVEEKNINRHIDSGCEELIASSGSPPPKNLIPSNVSSFFQAPSVRRQSGTTNTTSTKSGDVQATSPTKLKDPAVKNAPGEGPKPVPRGFLGKKHALETEVAANGGTIGDKDSASVKRTKTSKEKKADAFKNVPLAERMRPRTLDEVCGQELVGPSGVIRGLIEQNRVPSMILWGGPGTGKTTIARLIAHVAGCRFVEINSTSSGVGKCKQLFAEAKAELALTGRNTIIFCDEIHRFSKSQQDVFLGPVEAGQVTLIGATTENPSFKVVNPLLSRCRTFTLSKLTDEDIVTILKRALASESASGKSISTDDAKATTFKDGSDGYLGPMLSAQSSNNDAKLMSPNQSFESSTGGPSPALHSVIDDELLVYLAAFSDGDARTALNLLELALNLDRREGITKDEVKQCLTQTLVYDRAGDQHYESISAFQKSIRGSDPDAALYYLARMLQSGEDPLYIARRLVVAASEDIGLADNSMLSLAAAAYTAAEKIGMPECRINLAHATVALALARKSTRAYRGVSNAMAALQEPGVAGLPIPVHLKNAPTKLMKELGYGKEYKYNPHYLNGKVHQDYLPEKLRGRVFLEPNDLGNGIDPDLPG